MAKFKIKRESLKKAGIITGIVALLAVITILIIYFAGMPGRRQKLAEEAETCEPIMMYGIDCEGYTVSNKIVGEGETLSHLLGSLGISSAMIDKIDRESRPVYDMRKMRAGQPYAVFIAVDSLSKSDKVRHFVYEKNPTDYIVISLDGDNMKIRQDSKEVTVVRRKETAKIKSSLWNAIVEAGIPVGISCNMEDIFGWSVDFFGLQEEDEFTVIFEEHWIDTVRVGTGMVWGAEFKHNGNNYRAIPFKQDGQLSYWDETGNSLRRQFLKAPLKYTRISSRFTNSRLHPIYKIRRPHHGIDYAAPMGTPVDAIADGVVIERRWDSRGGGNMLKIKHANNYVSGYLHLKGYAKGISKGTRVKQGQTIAYVGSTGSSTGPHLDFRVWKGGAATDPLKLPSAPMIPISGENLEAFAFFRDRIIAELNGDVSEERKIKSLEYPQDTLASSAPQATAAMDK